MNKKKRILTIDKSSFVAGGYAPSSDLVYNEGMSVVTDARHSQYLPIMQDFMRKHSSEFRLVDPKNHSNQITGYTREEDSYLSETAIKTTRLDMSFNDFKVGSDVILLNFTDMTISTSLPGEMYKTYGRVVNDKLHMFDGKIVLFEVTSVNRQDVIADVTGVNDYYDSIIDKIGSLDDINKFKKTTDIIDKAKEIYENVVATSGEWRDNSVKVVNMLVIEGKDIQLLRSMDSLFLSEYNLLVSALNPFEMPANPLSRNDSFISQDLYEKMMANGIRCYINDPDNVISDRYIFVVNRVIKIPRIAERNTPRGLFIKVDGQIDQYGTDGDDSTFEKLIPLSDIDKVDYIYRSIDEAVNGQDRHSINENKYKEELLRLQNEKLVSEKELVNVKNKYDVEMLGVKRQLEELKLKNEQLKSENELVRMEKEHLYKDERDAAEAAKFDRKSSLDITKTEIDILREQMRADMDARDRKLDSMFEEQRWRREVYKSNSSTVADTLKIVGAGLALLAAGYAIYKKL